MKNIEIKQAVFSDEMKNHIWKSLGEHAIRVAGINGLAEEPVLFEMKNHGELIGCVVVQMFWGSFMANRRNVASKNSNKVWYFLIVNAPERSV